MIEAFNLLIDLKQETDDKLRLRTDIFSGDVQYVYLRKKVISNAKVVSGRSFNHEQS